MVSVSQDEGGSRLTIEHASCFTEPLKFNSSAPHLHDNLALECLNREDAPMRVRSRLDGSFHSAALRPAERSGERENLRLVLDEATPCPKALGPVTAALSLELVNASRTERRDLARAGYAVLPHCPPGPHLRSLASVLHRNRP